jgi:hypothetical protein
MSGSRIGCGVPAEFMRELARLSGVSRLNQELFDKGIAIGIVGEALLNIVNHLLKLCFIPLIGAELPMQEQLDYDALELLRIVDTVLTECGDAIPDRFINTDTCQCADGVGAIR